MSENTPDINENVSNWYVVYTYSGYENKVKSTLEKVVANRGLEDKIEEVIIPMEEEIEIKDGKQKTSIKKVFPGYVLVKMIMTDETWYVIKSIKGVFSFVGTGDKPLPLTEKEMISLGIGDEVLNLDFEEGDSVTIITEPFYNYPGIIESIDKEKQRVVVKVNMFNRETTVELGFEQIQKI